MLTYCSEQERDRDLRQSQVVDRRHLSGSGLDAYQRRMQMSQPAPAIDLNVSGEEAYERRLRMSSQVRPPAVEAQAQGRQEDVEPERQPTVVPGVAVAQQSVAQRLMAKMGWKKGQGILCHRFQVLSFSLSK